jgi:RimJ/RimL family protein N-acetyltransferase
LNWIRRTQVKAQKIPDILTPRLALIAITPACVRSEQTNDGQLGRLAGAQVTAAWPPEHWEPHVFDLLLTRYGADPADVGWNRYIAVRNPDGARTLIGTLGGFRRLEKPGECEVGYSVLPDFQRHGYATEGMLAFLGFVFEDRSMETVVAQTFPSLPASIRVMEKLGMTFVGPGYEEGTILYRRERRKQATP